MPDFNLNGIVHPADTIMLSPPDAKGRQRLSVNTDPETAFTLASGGTFSFQFDDGVGVSLELGQGQFSFAFSRTCFSSVTFDFEPGDDVVTLSAAPVEDQLPIS